MKDFTIKIMKKISLLLVLVLTAITLSQQSVQVAIIKAVSSTYKSDTIANCSPEVYATFTPTSTNTLTDTPVTPTSFTVNKDLITRKSKVVVNNDLHIGDFSQAQLPPTAIGYWARAYSPTQVEAYASTTTPTGRRPAEIYYAYGVDKASGTGAGQTIAIVVPAGSETLTNDLHVFSQYFNLPDATIQYVYPQGVPTVHSDGWALETTLDATWAHAMAPNAKILMVVCNTTAITGLLQGIDAAVANGATVVSMSWGSAENSGEANYDSHFNKPGVTFVAATGDAGYITSWPSVSPYVVAVGGTQLLSSGTSGTVTEQAWLYGSGGISKYLARPSWQAQAQSTSNRTTPDVSINACGYTIYCGNYLGQKGYVNVSGTSASAPIIAGLIARGYSLRTPGKTITDIHPTLYTSSNMFIKDITSGAQKNNTVDAHVGYDYETGLGVPNAPAFISTLSK